MMKPWRFAFFILLAALLASYTPKAFALSFGNGTYTNLCGTGLSASSDTCNRGCSTGAGSCSSSGSNVVKWTCDGRQTECRGDESSFSNSQSLAGTQCGKTVQIDVFDTTCRINGNWVCGDRDHMLDYIAWYSGDCIAPTSTPTPTASVTPTMTPTQTPTPTPSSTPTPSHASACDELSIVSGNNSVVPATITLRARGSDNTGSIQAYRFFWGDGRLDETTNSEFSHRYEISGTFLARAEVKDSQGVWKSSGNCEQTITVQPIAIESHKSGCSNVFITSGNYSQPPVNPTFLVTGFDNKGPIQRYKMDFGDGNVIEQSTNQFTHPYNVSGTYTVGGLIMDSTGNWFGGSGSCQNSLYVSTAPLTKQPSTGTPTAFTLLALTGGLWSTAFFFVKKYWVS